MQIWLFYELRALYVIMVTGREIRSVQYTFSLLNMSQDPSMFCITVCMVDVFRSFLINHKNHRKSILCLIRPTILTKEKQMWMINQVQYINLIYLTLYYVLYGYDYTVTEYFSIEKIEANTQYIIIIIIIILRLIVLCTVDSLWWYCWDQRKLSIYPVYIRFGW